MTDQLMGIDYFSLSTLMKDDDKVFDLKYRYAVPEGATGEAYDNDAAFAAYGRFVELLASIYREGFCLQMSKQTRLRLSQQLGLALPAFDAFIETCVEVGLFDSSLWNAERVLTSHGIQTRYFHAVKRRKGSLPTDLKPFILLGSNECEQDADTEGSATSDDARTVQTPCEHDANTLHTESDIEKKRIEKNKRGKNKITASSLSNSLLFEPKQQPYPLACLSCASGDGHAYLDDEDAPHPTPWDALVSRFGHVTGGMSIEGFARDVSKQCPAACPESDVQVSKCFKLLSDALVKYDPAKCASPTPLALAILKDRVIEDD